MQRNRNMDCS